MKVWLYFIMFAVLLIGIACPYYIKHSPELAIETARKFSEVVFVKHDYSFGLQFASKRRDADFTEAALKQMVEEMHPEGAYPTLFLAIGYEFVPGNRAAKVYLEGLDGTNKSYYLIELEGDVPSGYFVTGLYRRPTMFEVSGLYKRI